MEASAPSRRRKDGKDHTYWSLVETVRTAAGPRQRTVCYLGELNTSSEVRWRKTIQVFNAHGADQQLALFPAGAAPADPQVVEIRLDRVRWTRPWDFGDVWAGWQLWQRLGLAAFCEAALDGHCARRVVSGPSKRGGTAAPRWMTSWAARARASTPIASTAAWTGSCRTRRRSSTTWRSAETMADRPGTELSFGQQRLVEIARALVSQPKVLLLDEPAVGLSVVRVAEVDALLRRIRDERGITILLVEHVIRLVMEISDRVTVLNYGSKIAEGRPAEVAENPEVIEAYLGRSLERHPDARRP